LKVKSYHLTTFQRKMLLKSLQQKLRPEHRRRIHIMLLADEGKTQTEICEELKCSQETARYWTSIAQLGNAHEWNNESLGRPRTISDEYVTKLKQLVKHKPHDLGYPFKRWTAQWLGQHLAKELGIEVSPRHINRLLKSMGLSTRTSPEVSKSTNNSDTPNITINDLQSPTESNFIWHLNPTANNRLFS
jgi:transposase